MFGFLRVDRKKVIEDEINHISVRLTDDYSDIEIAEMVLAITERALTYLKHRREVLSDELSMNVESIKKLEE